MANIDKVALEQIIDKYLEDEVPLSYLKEELDLSFPQMRLLINRAANYNRKVDNLNRNYQNSSFDNVSQDYIAIPHNFPEENPFSGEEQIALFKRLEELKDSIPAVNISMVRMLDESISDCERELSEISIDDIGKSEKIAQEIENMRVNGDEFEDILTRNFITAFDLVRLDKIYTRYLELKNNYEELTKKREEVKRELKTVNQTKREIENIREQLVTHNVKLVNFCMRYFFNGIPVDQEEMQLYGLEGLARAINGFDYKKGYQFSSYAVAAIVHHIERNFDKLYDGHSWKDYCRKESIQYYRELYSREIGEGQEQISARVLAESGLVPLTERTIDNNDKLIDRIAPLSDVQEPFDDEAEYGIRDFPSSFEEYEEIDKYADQNEVEAVNELENEFVKKYAHERVAKVLKKLRPDQAQVLILRFGLEDGIERSYDEICKILNLSYERVRNLVASGLSNLRKPINVVKLRGLLELLEDSQVPQYISGIAPIESSKRL